MISRSSALRATAIAGLALAFSALAAVADEASSLINWGEWSEDRDTVEDFAAPPADVADSHPLVARAVTANPGRDVTVCMAGCTKGAGQAVFLIPRPLAKTAQVPIAEEHLVHAAPATAKSEPAAQPTAAARPEPAAAAARLAWTSQSASHVLAAWRGAPIAVASLPAQLQR